MQPSQTFEGGAIIETDTELWACENGFDWNDPKNEQLILTLRKDLPIEIAKEDVETIARKLRKTIEHSETHPGTRSDLRIVVDGLENILQIAKSEQLIKKLEETGWEVVSGGDTSVSGRIVQTGVCLMRKETGTPISPEAAIKRLGLRSNESDPTLVAGFEVDIDEDTQEFYISYLGPEDERYKKFIEDVAEFGKELSEEQAKAAAHNRLH